MKIEALKIVGYKNLEDVSVDFSRSGEAVVLVGPNGSGKSNLLEAIAIIFSDLALGRVTNFKYDIRYRVGSEEVRINSTPASKPRVSSKRNGKSIRRKDALALPTNIFGYYSGTRTSLPRIFQEHEDKYYRLARLPTGARLDEEGSLDLVGMSRTNMRRFFHGSLKNAPLVLLSYFSSDRGGLWQFLNEELAIESFDSALLTINRPNWLDPRPVHISDGKFPWDLTRCLDNEVGELLLRLWDNALAPFATSVEVAAGREEGPEAATRAEDRMFLFFPNVKSIKRARDPSTSPQQFFALLEALSVLGLLGDVRVWVKRSGSKEEISSTEISDGERQLLTIVGLLHLTPGENTLFLLDEPDTHLNPAWKWNFLQTIEANTRGHNACQFVLTSHDPLTIASLEQEDVQIFFKEAGTGRTAVEHPSVAPRGLGVAGVLRQIFGMKTTLDPETQKLIQHRYDLLTKQSRSRRQELQLLDLTNQIQKLGISFQNQQDLFEQFLKGLNLKASSSKTLSPSEVAQQNARIWTAIRQVTKKTIQ